MQNYLEHADFLASGLTPLRTVRVAWGLALRDTARREVIDPGHLSKAERGQAGLRVNALARLANVLGLTDLAKRLAPYRRT